jgi:hypothetical protein
MMVAYRRLAPKCPVNRPIFDAFALGVDGGVRRLETAYDEQGNAYLFTSYDAATSGSVVNQVQRGFNGLGQLTVEYQEHSGAVNTSTTPKVQYGYTEMSGGANHSRKTSMTYPSGRVVGSTYASGLDSSISRLSSLTDSGVTLESYTYLGLNTVVKRAHPQPGVDLTYIKLSGESNGDAGDQYIGLDRFGRIVDQRWVDGSGMDKDRYQYGYDRGSNRLWRDNLVNAAFGELYAYDGLNQLTSFQRGTLNSTKTGLTGSALRTQTWSYDALGNVSNLTTDGTSETRTHNKQNQLVSIGSGTMACDANGNMTSDVGNHVLVYNSWNNIVIIKSSGGAALMSMAHDALLRRSDETAGGVTLSHYYTAEWQVLEDRLSGVCQTQYVWSAVYVDAMVYA